MYLKRASGEGTSEKQHCMFGSKALYPLSHNYCSSSVVFLDLGLDVLAVRVVCSPVFLGNPSSKDVWGKKEGQTFARSRPDIFRRPSGHVPASVRTDRQRQADAQQWQSPSRRETNDHNVDENA